MEALRVAQKNKVSSEIYTHSQSNDSLPIEYLELQELREMIHRSLSKLSKTNQETAKAFYLDEKNCNEIAKTLGIPSGTVRRRLHQARNQLRSMLKGYCEELPKKDKEHEQDYGIPF